jgi:hypothetical protein
VFKSKPQQSAERSLATLSRYIREGGLFLENAAATSEYRRPFQEAVTEVE